MIPSLKSKARQSSLIALTLLSLSVAVGGADSATNLSAATAAADIVELSMSDPARWVMDTVHLGTKQVKITYDTADQAAVMTPTWSPSDRASDDVGVRNIENGRLQLYQLVDAKDCSQAVSGFEISMPQEYIAEGKLELVFALQAGAKGDYLFNGRTFTMADFAGNGGKYKKLTVRAPDYHEPLEKLRAIERVSFIFERKGSTISAPINIRHVTIDLNTEKITPPAEVVRVKNPKSFYEFTYTTQANVDGLTARVSAESMDITRRVNDAKDGMALIPQWKAGQIPAGHSGSVTLVQPLGAINDFERFEAEYVLNIPKAYFDEGKLDLWIFIQAGEPGYHRWSGTPRPLTALAEKAGQDVVLKVTEEDFRQGKQRNQIELVGLQLNRNGSTVTEPIMLKRITVKLPEDGQPQKATKTSAQPTVYGSPRMSQGHPRILMDKEDIARYREQLTRNGDLKAEFARLQKWGDQRIQQPVGAPKHETNAAGEWIYPEYKAGYKDAAGKYQWEWKFNTKLQRLANDVSDLGVLCALTGSQKYADYAKNILLALVDVYGHEKGNPPLDSQWKNHLEPFGFDGGDTALFLVKTCNGYDQIYNLAGFTPAERRQVEDQLIKPPAYHLKSQSYMFTSLQDWGMMCLYGVFTAGMTLDDPTLTNAALYGLNGTQEKPTGGIFGYWFNPAAADQDKHWAKSDTKSQLFCLSIMAGVAEVCWHHGIDLYRYHDATLKKIFDLPLAFSSTEASGSESLGTKYRDFCRLQGVTAYDYAFLRYRDPRYLPVIERMNKTLSMGGNCEIPCLFLDGESLAGRPSPESIASGVATTPPRKDTSAAAHASAEMLVNGSSAAGVTNWIFSNGFEDNIPGTGDWRKIWGSSWGEPNHAEGASESAIAVEGSHSMRVIYPKGGVGPQQTGIQWPTVTDRISGIEPAYEELYLRYYVYFEDGFDFKLGGKLPGMMSLGHPKMAGYVPDGTNAWLMRFMWREGGKAEVYSMLPPSKFNNLQYSYDVDLGFAFSTGKWYCIEQHIKLNSVGSDDGKLKVWIDGVNLLDRSDVLYRTVDNENVKIGGIYFSTFHGGDTMAWAPSVDSYARFDAVVLSKQRIGLIASEPAAASLHNDSTVAVRASSEMLVNGNFAAGMTNWVVEESGATGKGEVVAEGPGGKPAMRLKVLTVGDQPWRFQFYQPGMRVQKGKTYVLTFWAKSNQEGDFTVNCQQNHEPWAHPTQEEMPISTGWKQVQFTFVAAWDDDNARITFTNLGTAPGRIYWFANCSLMPTPEAKKTAALAPR